MLSGLTDGMVMAVAPTHLLAIVAIGLLAGEGGRGGSALALFALGLLAGSLAIASAIRETPSALVLLVMAAFVGITVAAAITLTSLVTNVLAFAAGLALALDTPPQATSIAVAVASQIGTGIAATAVLMLVTAIATGAIRPWQRIGLRVAGSWITASAILVLALRLAR
jgi:urease accessory protein